MLAGGRLSAVGLLAGFPIKVIYKSKGEGIAQIFHDWNGGFSIIKIVVLKLDYFKVHSFGFYGL